MKYSYRTLLMQTVSIWRQADPKSAQIRVISGEFLTRAKVISLRHTPPILSHNCHKLGELLMKMSQIFKTSQQPRCCHSTKNGSDCKATPQTGKQYCFFHDPATAKQRAEARRAGAAIRNQTTKLPPNFPIYSLHR